MTRVVRDTYVEASACFWRGICWQCLEAWVGGRFHRARERILKRPLDPASIAGRQRWRRGSESNTPEPGGPAHSGFEDRDPRFGESGRTFTITASIQGDLRLNPKVPPRQFPQISDDELSDIV